MRLGPLRRDVDLSTGGTVVERSPMMLHSGEGVFQSAGFQVGLVMLKCTSCGAPLRGAECEYCGTRYARADANPPKPRPPRDSSPNGMSFGIRPDPETQGNARR